MANNSADFDRVVVDAEEMKLCLNNIKPIPHILSTPVFRRIITLADITIRLRVNGRCYYSAFIIHRIIIIVRARGA